MKKKIIYGCEERGDRKAPYLTRFALINSKSFQLCLHIFHRSDAPDLHDHPWNFISLILWRGYIEETPKGKKKVLPGMVLLRKARHRHRVELINKKKAITLVIMGKRFREWGFITNSGWELWTKYFIRKGC